MDIITEDIMSNINNTERAILASYDAIRSEADTYLDDKGRYHEDWDDQEKKEIGDAMYEVAEQFAELFGVEGIKNKLC